MLRNNQYYLQMVITLCAHAAKVLFSILQNDAKDCVHIRFSKFNEHLDGEISRKS